MDSLEQFSNTVRWTAAEKKVTRRAFDLALERHLSAITAQAKRMMANVADPSELWQVETYLTESRKTVNRIFQFRYSDLLRVFSTVMLDGWLTEADLVGLQPEKIADITRGAESLRRILADQGE
jgi:hypothetical protein